MHYRIDLAPWCVYVISGDTRYRDIPGRPEGDCSMPNPILPGALAGLKVIDMSRLLPGPFCSMILADHGARVIAVESRRFADDGLFFETVYRNKEHMSLNLKTDRGREIFSRLMRDADVFMEGFRPGVARRLGIDYDSLRDLNPGLIYCAITGYGQNGPRHARVGHDVNFLGVSGVLDLIGEAGRPPCIPGVQIADLAGGGLNAVTGILLALVARSRDGRGQYIDISMTDGLVSLLAAALSLLQSEGRAPRRGDALLAHRYACYNVYETADGRYLTIGALEPRFWHNLCECLGITQYSGLQFDETRRVEIIQALRGAFRTRTLSEWSSVLADLDIGWGRVQNLEEVLRDPLFREREMILEIGTRDGSRTAAIGIPVKLSRTPGSLRTPPAAFGQHTRRILAELGYGQPQIDDFFATGAV